MPGRSTLASYLERHALLEQIPELSTTYDT